MGYYINPPNCSKEQWLDENGRSFSTLPNWADAVKAKTLPVCLVNNGLFTAAGVAFSQGEMEVFATEDGRTKHWFVVPIDKLKAVKALPQDFEVKAHAI